MFTTLYRVYGKIIFDFCVALVLLILVLPVFVLVALLVRCKLGAPIFFTQLRPGKNGRAFRIYKFRTMTNARDSSGCLLPDAQRLTPFGAFLRSTSLDELPELFNVLLGNMSLIGPRPLLVQYLERYTSQQQRRHAIKPGITGWAQINGRNGVEWDERFALDVWYVEHYNLLLDLRILLRTVQKVLLREGISAVGHATMSEFTGNRLLLTATLRSISPESGVALASSSGLPPLEAA